VSQNKHSQEDENLKARREREKDQREADLAAADKIKEKFLRRRERNINK